MPIGLVSRCDNKHPVAMASKLFGALGNPSIWRIFMVAKGGKIFEEYERKLTGGSLSRGNLALGTKPTYDRCFIYCHGRSSNRRSRALSVQDGDGAYDFNTDTYVSFLQGKGVGKEIGDKVKKVRIFACNAGNHISSSPIKKILRSCSGIRFVEGPKSPLIGAVLKDYVEDGYNDNGWKNVPHGWTRVRQ